MAQRHYLRAIASDMYSGNELTKFMALLMLVNGIAPVVAPTIGGIILNYSVWRMVFVILTILVSYHGHRFFIKST